MQELLQSGVLPCVPEVVNSIGMRFALIPAGRFLMGSPDDEEGRSRHEGPVHEVEITKPFYLGVHPVTQEQYETVMGNNPSWFSATGGGKDKVKWSGHRRRSPWSRCLEGCGDFLKKLAARPEEEKKAAEISLADARRSGNTLAEEGFLLLRSSTSATPSLRARPTSTATTPTAEQTKGPYLERTCKVGTYPPNALRPVRHARQRLGVVRRLVRRGLLR